MFLIYGYLFYYLAALIGISIGYHRYFSHRTFITSPFLEIVMLFFGQICGGRSPITWAAVHRLHHSTSDTEKDPHSPKYIGALNVLLSKWKVNYIPRKYIKDMLKNHRLVWWHKYGKFVHIVFAIIMFLIGFEYFVVFVVCPFIFSYIGFGLLNWLSHKDGNPIDLPLLNFIAPGEGWHKYHHEHPRSHKLNKFDIAGWLIERIFDKSKFSSSHISNS
jgi:stearoyl-CoA desaturase (delta-9 desaturase)